MITIRVVSQIDRPRTQHGKEEIFTTYVSVKSSDMVTKHNAEWLTTASFSIPVMDRRDKQQALADELLRLSKSFRIGAIVHSFKGEVFGTTGKNRVAKNKTILQSFATRFKLGDIK